jgi:hypothetical protein
MARLLLERRGHFEQRLTDATLGNRQFEAAPPLLRLLQNNQDVHFEVPDADHRVHL